MLRKSKCKHLKSKKHLRFILTRVVIEVAKRKLKDRKTDTRKRILCQCGSSLLPKSVAAHQKTLKHQAFKPILVCSNTNEGAIDRFLVRTKREAVTYTRRKPKTYSQTQIADFVIKTAHQKYLKHQAFKPILVGSYIEVPTLEIHSLDEMTELCDSKVEYGQVEEVKNIDSNEMVVYEWNEHFLQLPAEPGVQSEKPLLPGEDWEKMRDREAFWGKKSEVTLPPREFIPSTEEEEKKRSTELARQLEFASFGRREDPVTEFEQRTRVVSRVQTPNPVPRSSDKKRIAARERENRGIDRENALRIRRGLPPLPRLPPLINNKSLSIQVKDRFDDDPEAKVDRMLTVYAPVTIKNFAGARPTETELTTRRGLNNLLHEYLGLLSLPKRDVKYSYQINFDVERGTGGSTAISTPFVSTRADAEAALRDWFVRFEERYRSDDINIISFQLRTLSIDPVFRGKSKGTDVEVQGMRAVKYNSRKNCVIMALFLGKEKLKDAKAKHKGEENKILACPNKVWQSRLRHFKKRILLPALKERGLEKTVADGVIRGDIAAVADVMGVTVVERNTNSEVMRTYNGGTGQVVNVIMTNGHCELLVNEEDLDKDEIIRLNSEDGTSFVKITKRETSTKGFMAADIEAWSSGEHKAYAIRSVDGVTGEVISFRGVDCIGQWLDVLAGKKNSSKDKETGEVIEGDPVSNVIYYHNGQGYDFYLLRNRLLTHDGFDIMGHKEICNGSSMISFSVKSKNGVEYKFRDSYLLLQCALGKLTKDLDVKHKKLKETVNFDEINEHFDTKGFTNETIEKLYELYPAVEKYLEHDVLGLLEVVQKIGEIAISRGVDITACPTLTSLSKRIFTVNHLGKQRISNLTDAQDKYVKTGLFPGSSEVVEKEYRDCSWILGGNCDAKYIGKIKSPVYMYDVTSLYPSVCMHDSIGRGLLPVQTLGGVVQEKFTLDSVWDFDLRFDSRRRYFVEVWVKTFNPSNHPVHMIKVKHENAKRNVNANISEWTRMVLYSEEIRYGLQTRQYKYRVKSYQAFTAVAVFHGFMEDMMKTKTNARKEGKSALAMFAKIAINSLTGAPGMDCNNRTAVKLVHKKQASYIETAIMQDKLIDFNEVGDYLSIHMVSDIKKTFFNRAMYAAITSKGRMVKNRFELMVESVGGKVLYGDTDSVITNIDCSQFETFSDVLGKGRTGSWENELPNLTDSYTHGYIGGCKSYYLYNPDLPHGKTNPKVSQKGFHARRVEAPTCEPNLENGKMNPEMLKYRAHGGPTEAEFKEYVETRVMSEPEANTVFRRGVNVAMKGEFKLKTEIVQPKKFTLNYKKGCMQKSGWVTPFNYDGKKLSRSGEFDLDGSVVVDRQKEEEEFWLAGRDFEEDVPNAFSFQRYYGETSGKKLKTERPIIRKGDLDGYDNYMVQTDSGFKKIPHLLEVFQEWRPKRGGKTMRKVYGEDTAGKIFKGYWDNKLGTMLFNSMEGCFEYARNHDLHFFFRYTDWLYGAVESQSEFRALYEEIPTEFRFFHELINPDKEILPFWDVDYRGTEADPEYARNSVIPWIIERWAQMGLGALLEEDFIINESPGFYEKEGKKMYNNSWHLFLNNGQSFKNVVDMKRWSKAFFRIIPEELYKAGENESAECVMDVQVYRRWGGMRISGSRNMKIHKRHLVCTGDLTFASKGDKQTMTPATNDHANYIEVEDFTTDKIHPFWYYFADTVGAIPSRIHLGKDNRTDATIVWLKKGRSAVDKNARLVYRPWKKTIVFRSEVTDKNKKFDEIVWPTSREEYHDYVHILQNLKPCDLVSAPPEAEVSCLEGDVRNICEKYSLTIDRKLQSGKFGVSYKLDERNTLCPHAGRSHNHAWMRLIYQTREKRYVLSCHNNEVCKRSLLVLSGEAEGESIPYQGRSRSTKKIEKFSKEDFQYSRINNIVPL